MKYLKIIALIPLLFSCSGKETPLKEFTVGFSNQSSEKIEIRGFNNFDELIFVFEVDPGDRNGLISYQDENFGGYSSQADSLVTRFSNGKGYICDLRGNGNGSCFISRNPLLGFEEDFNNLGNNTFEFVITQTDFDNAFELP
jgi:hypothetical protein